MEARLLLLELKMLLHTQRLLSAAAAAGGASA